MFSSEPSSKYLGGKSFLVFHACEPKRITSSFTSIEHFNSVYDGRVKQYLDILSSDDDWEK